MRRSAEIVETGILEAVLACSRPFLRNTASRRHRPSPGTALRTLIAWECPRRMANSAKKNFCPMETIFSFHEFHPGDCVMKISRTESSFNWALFSANSFDGEMDTTFLKIFTFCLWNWKVSSITALFTTVKMLVLGMLLCIALSICFSRLSKIYGSPRSCRKVSISKVVNRFFRFCLTHSSPCHLRHVSWQIVALRLFLPCSTNRFTVANQESNIIKAQGAKLTVEPADESCTSGKVSEDSRNVFQRWKHSLGKGDKPRTVNNHEEP